MNITLANYPSMAPNVNWSKYPSIQKEVYDQNKAGSLDFEYWKEFLEDEEIKAIVAKHIAVLNTAKGSAKGKAVIAKATKAKTSKASRTTSTQKVAAKRAASKTKVEPAKVLSYWNSRYEDIPEKIEFYKKTDLSTIKSINGFNVFNVKLEKESSGNYCFKMNKSKTSKSIVKYPVAQAEVVFFAASKPKVEPVKAVAKPARKGINSQLNKGDFVIEKSTKRKGIISEKEVDKRGGYVYSFLPNNSTKPTLYYDFLPKSDELNSNKLILDKNPSMIEMPFSNKPKVEPVKAVAKPALKAKPAPKPKAMAKPKIVKAKAPAKPKTDPKKAIKTEIANLQNKSKITATAMRKINSISVDTIRQMKGLAGDREMESLKYERDILKAVVAKDTAKLKRIAKSSNIDANILTDILPKRK